MFPGPRSLNPKPSAAFYHPNQPDPKDNQYQACQYHFHLSLQNKSSYLADIASPTIVNAIPAIPIGVIGSFSTIADVTTVITGTA